MRKLLLQEGVKGPLEGALHVGAHEVGRHHGDEAEARLVPAALLDGEAEAGRAVLHLLLEPPDLRVGEAGPAGGDGDPAHREFEDLTGGRRHIESVSAFERPWWPAGDPRYVGRAMEIPAAPRLRPMTAEEVSIAERLLAGRGRIRRLIVGAVGGSTLLFAGLLLFVLRGTFTLPVLLAGLAVFALAEAVGAALVLRALSAGEGMLEEDLHGGTAEEYLFADRETAVAFFRDRFGAIAVDALLSGGEAFSRPEAGDGTKPPSPGPIRVVLLPRTHTLLRVAFGPA